MPERSARELIAVIDSLDTPAEVLAALDRKLRSEELQVLVAWWLPPRTADFKADFYVPNKTMFSYGKIGEAIVREWLIKQAVSQFSLLARRRVAPVTLTEAMHELRLVGDDLWIIDLFHRNGMRDVVYCPYRNWMLALGSTKVLHLNPLIRFRLSMVVQIAADRLNRLKRDGLLPYRDAMHSQNQKLPSQRELLVLSHRSVGLSAREIGTKLKISPGTVKTHQKRVIAKLDARDVTHAVGNALRRGLIT